MKKVLLIIFILLLSFTNVYALESSFDSYDSLNNVMYYKRRDGTYIFRWAKEIRDVKTGNTAYCIEPFKDLQTNTNYISSNNQLGFSNERWNKAKLIAYYGYGYKGHTEKKWITITQLSIWRTLYPEFDFEWVNPDTRTVITPYNNEINELNRLVNNHNILPNIQKEIKTSINTTLELNDTNNVLENYTIISSDFDSKILNNKLIINTKEEKEGEIKLQRASNIYKNDFTLFTNNGSQSVVERGNIIPINFNIKVIVESGTIKVTKVDKDTDLIDPQGDASLDGAVYEVYDEDMNFIQASTVEDNIATFDNLKYGKYYVKERSAGEGYYVDDEIYEVEINDETTNQKVRLGNFVIKSKINIIKKYGSLEDYNNNKMKREKGIVFNIYNKNEELVESGVTDDQGELKIELPYGEYTIRQVNTTDGYSKIEDYKLIVGKDNNISETIVFNDFKVEVPNAGIKENIWVTWLKQLCLH